MAGLLQRKISGLYVAGLFYFNNIPLWVDLTTKLLSLQQLSWQALSAFSLVTALVGGTKTNYVQANLIITLSLGSIETDRVISEPCYNEVTFYRHIVKESIWEP